MPHFPDNGWEDKFHAALEKFATLEEKNDFVWGLLGAMSCYIETKPLDSCFRTALAIQEPEAESIFLKQ